MKMYTYILLFFLWTGLACANEKSTPVVADTKSAIKDVSPPAVEQPKSETSAIVSKKANTPTDQTQETKLVTPKKKEKEQLVPVEKTKKIEPKVEKKKVEAVKEKVQKKAPVKAKTPPPPPPIEQGKLFFPDTIHDYGFIDEGDTIKHSFRFLNDGTANLEILDVQVSCGCTVPVYSLEPIGPGRLSKIDITFLSQGKIGSQLATIDVLTNAKNPKQTLYLKGVVR